MNVSRETTKGVCEMKEHLKSLGTGLLVLLIFAAVGAVCIGLVYAITLYPTHLLSITLYTVIILLIAFGTGSNMRNQS